MSVRPSDYRMRAVDAQALVRVIRTVQLARLARRRHLGWRLLGAPLMACRALWASWLSVCLFHRYRDEAFKTLFTGAVVARHSLLIKVRGQQATVSAVDGPEEPERLSERRS
ncbi:MAG: hypothetical protein R3F15_02270 [Lysobacterales bacterium]